jgi:hypothetical protein
MKIVFHIAALKEFRDERRYYNARVPGLGDRLIALVDDTLAEIARAPQSFPCDRKPPRARRARIRGKFPHALIFSSRSRERCGPRRT